MNNQSVTVLFSGYAPVHFICFQPLMEHLQELPGVSITLSGGTRELTPEGFVFDAQALYRPFKLKNVNYLSVEEASNKHFNIVISACTNMITTGTYDVSIQIFHGNSFRNRAIRSDNSSYDHYFMIGPYMKRSFSESGIISENDPRILDIGFMKTDKMLNGSWKREQVLRDFGFSGDRKVVLFAPTGQKYNSLETMGYEVLKDLCETDRYDVILKAHDHPKNDSTEILEKLKAFESDHFVVTQEKDVAKCLFAADLLITDASSVSSEYSLLDRPMIFLDVPKLFVKARKKLESKMDMKTWGRKAGRIISLPEEAVDMVDYCLSHQHEISDVRKAMAADLYFNPGSATEKAMKWMKVKIRELQNRNIGVEVQ